MGIEKKEINMESEVTISLVVIIILAILVLRFVARLFLKLILIIILGGAALYMFMKAGVL